MQRSATMNGNRGDPVNVRKWREYLQKRKVKEPASPWNDIGGWGVPHGPVNRSWKKGSSRKFCQERKNRKNAWACEEGHFVAVWEVRKCQAIPFTLTAAACVQVVIFSFLISQWLPDCLFYSLVCLCPSLHILHTEAS